MDNDYQSDQFKFDIKQSKIPQAGLGVFAKEKIAKDELLFEYRGPVINSSNCWHSTFTYEDKMIYINSDFSVLGRNIGSRVNDIIKFTDFDSITQQLIEKQSTFPTHDFQYNAYTKVIGDKIFLAAMTDITIGSEIYFNYSFDYWKWFYDQWKQSQLPLNQFFDYWEKQKIIFYQKYQPFIIAESDTLKIQLHNNAIKCTSLIHQNEIIIECRGNLINQPSENDPLILPISMDRYIEVTNLAKYILQNKTKMQVVAQIEQYRYDKSNSSLKRISDKYFIRANSTIQKGDTIFLYDE